MDEFDQASELEEAERARGIAAVLAAQGAGESAHECIGCGEPIPQARREAVMGCRYCVVCQSRRERVGRRMSR
ncbi:TraR/DksA C4-type zinc finger protein [Burkholderia pyrrocinia]|uniref:TraR/DksA C4-type zinc finger protein n=1 Tax=Burkholderia pyrrocinia TaxID=60550 RepID=UPI001BCAD73B|nr:TraR/DksA C4-type zinc finger protein [Burkholderia pyrrocinia]QVN18981.1 TraR/DksA C4-type zinc finger protein [Burkholderia pyrrocinia]